MSGKSKAEEVLQDNPDAMHDLMQKIRSDPNYITSLYKDCPGMRRVLDEHPDLKKIFENPDIMRRSFEAVYIKNGGEPEPVDEDDSDCKSFLLVFLIAMSALSCHAMLPIAITSMECTKHAGIPLVPSVVSLLFESNSHPMIRPALHHLRTYRRVGHRRGRLREQLWRQ